MPYRLTLLIGLALLALGFLSSVSAVTAGLTVLGAVFVLAGLARMHEHFHHSVH